MSIYRAGSQLSKPTLRLLILDGTPGATTVLTLAAHRALSRPEVVLIPDTGWYPARTYEHLDRLAHLAASVGIETLWVDGGAGTAAATYEPSTPCPLPLHTRTLDGAVGQLPNGCATAQAAAIDSAIWDLLAHVHTNRLVRGVVAECVLGLGAEHADLARPAEAPYRRNSFPLVELGWTTADCRALLAMHDLAFVPDVACIACPNRGGAAWAELRATDPEAWDEAVAMDAALRHRPQTPASGGMPPDATGYLHAACVPLPQVELDTAPEPGSHACVPYACRGISCFPPAPKGGAT